MADVGAETGMASKVGHSQSSRKTHVDYAIYMLDPNGIVTSWNEDAQRIEGYRAEEILSAHYSRFFTPEDQERGEPGRVLRVAREKGQFKEEGVRLRKDGSSFHAHVVVEPARDGAGKLIGYIKMIRDMTEQTAVKNALDESERRFRLLVEGVTNHAISMLDPAGYIIDWNPGAQRMKGYEPGEILGQHFSKFYTEEDRAAGKPEQALHIAATTGKFEEQGWRLRKDGSRFWADVSIAAVRTETGELAGYVALVRDITEQRKAQEALHESERRFRVFIDSVVDYAIYMLDPSGHVSNWNAGAQRIKGYNAEEIVGQHYSKFFTEEDREAGIPERNLRIAATQGKFEDEGWRVRKDGSRFWANVSITPVRDNSGGLVGFAKVTRDVTEQRKAHETLEQTRAALFQLHKMQAMDQVTGGVAHDFNNLLTVVVGNLDLISRMAVNSARIRQLAASALKAASRGARLTQQLLAFARRQTLRPKVVDPNRLIQEFEGLIRQALGEAIEVRLLLEPELHNCSLDQVQFETAILNLTLNARDAMLSGGQLTIETQNVVLQGGSFGVQVDVKPGDYVLVNVSDSGCGIAQDLLPRVFEPFFTTKDIGEGSGLGLSQVYGFVNQSGGFVQIDSEQGRGTTVSLYLPKATEAETEAADDVDSLAEHTHAGHETILVVEDDEDVLAIAVDTLAGLGYHVLATHDGPEALEVLKQSEPIDLVFSDVVMPRGMNGFELAREAKRLRPEIRLLLTSGYAMRVLARDRTMDKQYAILRKPYRSIDLAEKVRSVLAAGTAAVEAREQDQISAHAGAAPAQAGAVSSFGPMLSRGMSPLRVLVVEDDELLRMSTVDMIKDLGYTVFEAPHADAALDFIETVEALDVLFTDIRLPGKSGRILASEARRRRPDLKIIFASGYGETVPQSVGRAVGKSFYLNKPYKWGDLKKAFESLAEQRPS